MKLGDGAKHEKTPLFMYVYENSSLKQATLTKGSHGHTYNHISHVEGKTLIRVSHDTMWSLNLLPV